MPLMQAVIACPFIMQKFVEIPPWLPTGQHRNQGWAAKLCSCIKKKNKREKWAQGLEKVVYIVGRTENGLGELREGGQMNLSFSAVMSFLHEMPHFLRPPFAGTPNSQGWKRLSQNPAGALDI